MARRTRRVDLLAGAVAGAVLAAGAEAGAALLLYRGQGLLGAVGVLLALVLAALAAGLWVGTPTSANETEPAYDGATRSLRRRWVGAVVAFVIAAVFAEIWTGQPGVQGTALGRALAVLFLLAEPAYASGSLLAGLRVRLRAARADAVGKAAVGVSAARTAQAPAAPGVAMAESGDGRRRAENADGVGLTAAVLVGAAAGVFAAGTTLIPELNAWVIFISGAAALAVTGIWEARPSGSTAQQSEASMDGAMDGNVVLITGFGAPGQLSYALVEAFRGAGWRVAVTGRSGEVADRARDLTEPPGQVVGVAGDLTREDDAARIMDALRDRFDRLDALVNVAGGLGVVKPLAETTADEWQREVARNAETAFVMSRAALPLLRERGGAIVNFASPAGLRAIARLGAYSAGKAAVIALTRALALEERQNAVRVNAVAPGMIDTQANREAVEDPSDVEWVTREEIARVVLFLVSDASSGISGETIRVLGEGLR